LTDEEDSTEAEQGAGVSEPLDPLLVNERRKSEDYLTRLRYLQADFENYRKRTEKELRDAEDSSLRGLVTRLLSAVDELDLAVKNAGKDVGGKTLLDGLKMVRKNLMSSLEASGLSKIECVGKPFDPSLHEAVEKVQGSAPGSDMVKDEIRPGYVFRGKVVRPSMVKVELALKTPNEQEEERVE
jgi:molecular chaperone GrpE